SRCWAGVSQENCCAISAASDVVIQCGGRAVPIPAINIALMSHFPACAGRWVPLVACPPVHSAGVVGHWCASPQGHPVQMSAPIRKHDKSDWLLAIWDSSNPYDQLVRKKTAGAGAFTRASNIRGTAGALFASSKMARATHG